MNINKNNSIIIMMKSNQEQIKNWKYKYGFSDSYKNYYEEKPGLSFWENKKNK